MAFTRIKQRLKEYNLIIRGFPIWKRILLAFCLFIISILLIPVFFLPIGFLFFIIFIKVCYDLIIDIKNRNI